MNDTIEQLADKKISKLWCEAQPVARPFVMAALREIPKKERTASLLDTIVTIGENAYTTTCSDYDSSDDDLRLSRLEQYSENVISAVLKAARDHLLPRDFHGYIGQYLHEFKSARSNLAGV